MTGTVLTRRRAAALLLAVAASAAAACAPGPGSGTAAAGSPGTVVTLRVGDQKAGSEALLKAAGLLGGTPYRISWATFTSGPPLLEAVNAGAVDIGGVGNTPPVFAAASGSAITAVAAYRQSAAGSAVLVPGSSPITAPAQLRGRRIAVAKGSSAHYHLLAVLKREGISFADIRPQYLQPADALAAFSSGTVDAWAIWDPFTSQALLKHGARVLVDGDGYVNGLGFQVAARDALRDPGKEAAIRDFLSRLARARAWSVTHQAEWAQVWARETGLPGEVTRAAAANIVSTPVPIDDSVAASEQRIADAFAAEGLIPGRVRFSDFLDGRFNDLLGKGA
ncbi:ABC transporter substrate-binding protein [Microtetraspora niveoalba]|uniref:ABC transporter substrate-binding protein n=1 Tax=Microtetraspora niveoalba TaxID=46175 RepID=UPI000A0754F7|nr:ABC transporter substrate-binding protein [Microtetraspora niveoalba]